MKKVQDIQQVIQLPQLLIKLMKITLVGDSELVTHKWPEKAKKEMLDKQMKKAKQGKKAKDPFMDYVESMYWITKMPKKPTHADIKKAKFGVRSVSFKSAAVNACSHVDGITKVEARGAFHIEGELVEIKGSSPHMREDMVRIGMGVADLRYRGGFSKWECDLPIRYNANVISPEQIANLFNTAGFAMGIGEMRPQKSGDSFGMFHVKRTGE